jgi:transmembrane sensor
MRLNRNDIDRLVSTYREDYTPDVEEGLSRLRERIVPVRQLHPPPRQGFSRWLPLAATVAAVLLLVVFLFSGDGRVHLDNPDEALAVYTLPDGSTVTLQQHSELSYDPDIFGIDSRPLDLTGQAYFEVQSDRQRPFLVSNGRSQLRVTGTAFNLRSGNRVLEVEVSEGEVILQQGGQRVRVAARETAKAVPGQPLTHQPAPNLNHHAWRTGELRFDRTPISEVLQLFDANWDIECNWSDNQACQYTVSGHYRGGDAGAILADIAKLGGATLRALDDSGKKYELSGPCSE